MPLFLITAPTDEPIEVDEAKHQVQQDAAVVLDDDAFEVRWIPAARERCENATLRQMLTAIWEWQGPCFPTCGWPFEVPRAPLQSVSSVKYLDAAGDLQTWANSNYVVSAPTGPKAPRGTITPVYGVTWPATYPQINAVRIRFTCGYGDEASDVPPLLRQAMLLDVGSMFVHRESVVMDPATEVVLELPGGSKDIYRSYKSRALYPLPD